MVIHFPATSRAVRSSSLPNAMFFISTPLASSTPVIDPRTLWLSQLIKLSALRGLYQGQHTLHDEHLLVGTAIEQLFAHPSVHADDISVRISFSPSSFSLLIYIIGHAIRRPYQR
jgi:hypothetical protein